MTVRCNLAMLYEEQGCLEQAWKYSSNALKYARELGSTVLEGTILGLRGAILGQRGDFVRARRDLKQGATLLSASDDLMESAKLQCYRAKIERLAGNAEGAVEARRLAEEVARELDVTADSGLAEKIAALKALEGDDAV